MNYISFLALAAGVAGLYYYTYVRDKPKQVRAAMPQMQYAANPLPQIKNVISSFRSKPQPVPASRTKLVKDGAPLSGSCTSCNNTVALPFRCKYCGELHCGEHRLPEDHKCKSI